MIQKIKNQAISPTIPITIAHTLRFKKPQTATKAKIIAINTKIAIPIPSCAFLSLIKLVILFSPGLSDTFKSTIVSYQLHMETPPSPKNIYTQNKIRINILGESRDSQQICGGKLPTGMVYQAIYPFLIPISFFSYHLFISAIRVVSAKFIKHHLKAPPPKAFCVTVWKFNEINNCLVYYRRINYYCIIINSIIKVTIVSNLRETCFNNCRFTTDYFTGFPRHIHKYKELLWASLFSKDLYHSGDIFDTPNGDAHTYLQKVILSINQNVFLYTLKVISMDNNTYSIPTRLRESEGSKTLRLSFQITLTVVFIRYKDCIFIVWFMSPVKRQSSPVQQEYFQPPSSSGYKVYSRYKISTITLENFGLEIDQRMREHPSVRSTDKMNINTPSDEKNLDADKPFCCTHCGSESYKKYGKKNDKQVYKCKSCNRKFVDNLFFERRKTNPKIICLTLDLYFKGVSLRKISDHLKQFHDIDVCFTTVFRWIDHYIRIMDEYVRQFKPNLSELWNVDEMMISVNGDWFYLWNVIDDETRFHLASVISKERKTEDARKALITAKKRSHGNRPKYIITDGLKSYVKAVDEEFHTARRDTIHVGNVGIRGKDFNKDIFDNNLVERLQGTIRERNKTQRGLKDKYSAFIRGHQLYYNFVRPHQSLFDCTPAEFAGIDLGLGNNKWENLLIQSVKSMRKANE